MLMRLTTLALLLAATVQASPEDDVTVATMRLADEPSDQDGRVLKYYIEIEGVLLVDGAPGLVHHYATTVLDIPGFSPFGISEDLCREVEL